jgi:hypothetical protein
MAFIDLDSDDPAGNASFYNVNSGVGYGQTNMEEDVKVVQFFLTRLYSVPKMVSQKPYGDMAIDGKVGPITRNWIVKTQLIARNKGTIVLVDGIVDKAGNENNGSNWTSSISQTRYTIRVINNFLRQNDTAVYKTLPSNSEVPPEMRAIFQQIHAAGPPMTFGDS